MKKFCVLLFILMPLFSSIDTNFLHECSTSSQQLKCNSLKLTIFPDLGKNENYTLIDFSLNKIVNIPLLPKINNLTYLILSHNDISQIENKAFFNLTSLTYLDLSFNELTSAALKQGIFKGPYQTGGYEYLSISVLKLGSNSIHNLNADLFSYLLYLEELYLDSNPIKIIDHNTLIALGNLHELKVLDISRTSLSTIPTGMLYSLHKLEYLSIAECEFSVLPDSLSESTSLQHLVIDGNPIVNLSYFPVARSLITLEIKDMPKLIEISDYCFTNVSNLDKLVISYNQYLVNLKDRAFQTLTTDENAGEGPHYLPLTKLYIDNNRLEVIDESLFNRWDHLQELNLDFNPWSCDCRIQWFLSRLIPVMRAGGKNTSNLLCSKPEEMFKMKMDVLVDKPYHLRCLDTYGNHPEKDVKVLIILLVAALLAIPIALIIVGYLKKPQSLSSYYPKAVYKKAVSLESVETY